VDPETAVRHQRFREAGGVVENDEQERLLDAILWQSPYLSAFLIRDPQALQRLAADPHLKREKPAARMRRELAGQPLRRYRNQEYLRLGARELGWGRPEEVGRELSHLADACLDEAIAVARASLIEKYGPPLTADGRPCRFVVFGMGKLGGEELNFSSDIDLIYVYETDQGGCASGLTLHEFFSRLAERVTRAIADVTDEGYCFRVDLRLRPEGTRGPLANSLPASEHYYESWGRPWERQAWLKARPVAGDLDLGWEMLSILEPFVWPRSSGPQVIAAVHELMGRIRAELGTPNDVKVGPGGIREIEFFVQALQMVHSRMPSLRERNTRRALDKLLFAGLVSEREHRALTDAYVFLRRLEHRLQLEEGRQTHAVPADRGNLSHRLGFAGVPAFDAALAQHRRQVSDIYATLGIPEEAPSAEVLALVDPGAGHDTIREALAKLGFADPDASADEMELLRQKPQSPFASGRPIAPVLLGEVAQSPDPDLALRRLVDLVGRRGEGATIWRLMEAHRPLMTLLVSLFGTSEYLGKVFVAHPELLEELATASRAEPVRPRAKLDDRVSAALAGLPFDDEEGRLNALRRFKNEEVLRVGLYDIAGELAPPEVSSQLSDLAEAILEATLATIAPGVFARWGTPTASLAVLGLGKLGARELTYASDLDLVFVYSDEGDDFEIFSRLGQRLLHALGSYLDEGRLYEVDTRLRPSGQQGTLVSSLAGFRAYHDKQALLWERQALIKIRTVAGDRALGRAVEEEAARHIWNAAPDPNMAEEIGRLRARMEKELARETAHRFNIKSGRGGLLDIEFLTQYLQLREGPARPSLRVRGTAAALAALRDEGILLPDVAAALADSYAFLRKLENRLRIVNDRSIAEITDLVRDVDKLARRCGYHGESPGARLLGDYRAHTDSVRALYGRYLPAANLQSSSTSS
jgi:[glutamine synthetase] adenylyltransferase / [glutamine synthetase]-adenylyl-L-tyrosine phosphorylase